jgi:hypothetical protein
MSIEPYRTGKAGRPVRAITMEDRLRRYRVMQKVEQYTDEIVALHVDQMRNAAFEDGKPNMERRMKAGRWLWEACYGKPGQAIQLQTAPEVQRTLIVRWLPPDPNDRSNVIEPEPD